jgi:protein-S-isoprenylcysteine O-methyltransferase Ste14
MTVAIIIVQLAAFTAIGLLPPLFFRRGAFNPRWWATAIPFFVDPVALLTVALGWLTPIVPPHSAHGRWLLVLSVPPALTCLVLIIRSVRAHHAAPALWHQEDDEPARVVRSGPYRRIRHPFYAAFLLAFAGATLAAPHPVTIGCLLYGMLALNLTAVREERRLLASRHGVEYRHYISTAGRFFPWPRGIGR